MPEAFFHHLQAAPGGKERFSLRFDCLFGPIRRLGGGRDGAAREVEVEVVASVIPIVGAQASDLEGLRVNPGAPEINRDTERDLADAALIVAIAVNRRGPLGTGGLESGNVNNDTDVAQFTPFRSGGWTK